MSHRDNHKFQFTAARISEAAKTEAEYHRKREQFWREEQEKAAAIVKGTMGCSLKEMSVTGGVQYTVVVDYGDPTAYQRMNQAATKINLHRQAAERLESDAELYGTQSERSYELDGTDVAHWRLHNAPRGDDA